LNETVSRGDKVSPWRSLAVTLRRCYQLKSYP